MTREQDDERVAHLTHVSEIKKKSEALAKTTATLQDVIHNKVSLLLETAILPWFEPFSAVQG